MIGRFVIIMLKVKVILNRGSKRKVNRRFGLLVILAAMVVSVFAVNSGVLAQEEGSGGSGFRISPTRDQFAVDKGETTTKSLFVRNVSADVLTARAVVDDFSASDDESGTPRLLIGDLAEDDYPYSIKPFVQSIPDVSLAPGEEREIEVTINVPEGTAPGSYYGLVRFIPIDINTGEINESAVSLSASVGTIYLIDVPGDTVNLLSLEEISVLKDGSDGSFFSSAPGAVAIRLRNEGNTFQAPFGRVLVKNWSGDTVYEYEINNINPRGNVLPGTVRRFENEIQGLSSFGRFTVEANISYGDGGNIITAKKTFWVAPWKTIGIIVVLLAVAIVVGVKGLKAYNRKVIEKAKGTKSYKSKRR